MGKKREVAPQQGPKQRVWPGRKGVESMGGGGKSPRIRGRELYVTGRVEHAAPKELLGAADGASFLLDEEAMKVW